MSVAVDEYVIECVLERELVACVRVWDSCSCPCDRVQVDLQRQGAFGGQLHFKRVKLGEGLAIKQSKSLCVSWLAMPFLRDSCRSEREKRGLTSSQLSAESSPRPLPTRCPPRARRTTRDRSPAYASSSRNPPLPPRRPSECRRPPATNVIKHQQQPPANTRQALYRMVSQGSRDCRNRPRSGVRLRASWENLRC